MKKRVISAIVAIIIILPIIILGGIWFYIGASVLGVIGFNEILTIRDKEKRLPLLVKVLSLISFILIMLNTISNNITFSIDYKIIITSLLLCSLPMLVYKDKNVYDAEDAFYIIGITIFLGVAFNYIISIRNLDLMYLLYLVLITTLTDTFAHFWGTKIGKHKLCESISPNKTIEGMVGGTIMGSVVGSIFFLTFVNYAGNVTYIILVSIFLSLIGQFGDLIFSAIKRRYNVKDFGNIMPGHGGVLDRLDSLLLVVLAFSLIISCL